MLKGVARALASALQRSEDIAARYGGEEIVLVSTDVDGAGAAAIAEKARQAVLNLRIAHEATELGMVSVSCGVAVCFPRSESTSTELLRAADVALYKAKGRGKNAVVIKDIR